MRGKATHTVQPFLQKIWSEGVLRRLTLLLFPLPRTPYRVLFDYIHTVCKGRGQGAGRGGSLSAVVSAVFRCKSVSVVSVSALSHHSYMFHVKHYCISWGRTYVLYRCSIVWSPSDVNGCSIHLDPILSERLFGVA